ncbi:MAG TPA: FAD-linked oxidase C-terminal domain-containing protein [Desulfovibrio sp.]|uniref:FAD-binding oxidoreductase n=1 Tax=Desulfovibrio sp. TaxID=885 RepID=UPI002D6EAFDC|nr:FAD-linked oxidase C-terminal domain-containing protein [Desulfovibrio sp.]HZF61287.1 FAD-linked oxidase C-terminal domain-containing protein [Desulfovibrio sp.]
MLTKEDIRTHIAAFIGEKNMLTKQEDLVCYTYNAGGAAPSAFLPILVALPVTAEEVSKIVGFCNEHKISVVTRSQGSGLSVNAITESDYSIIISLQRMNSIIVEPEILMAVVGPGAITADIKKAAAAHSLMYPPDPASFTFSSIGGNVATDAGGLQCVKYGTTKSYVTGMQVVLASGEIIRAGGKCIKDVTGYNLTQLFTGSEGTLGVITEITLKLIPLPQAKRAMRVAFNNIENAAKAVSAIMTSGVVPSIMEFQEQTLIRAVEDYTHAGLPVDAGAMLLIEVDGDVSTLKPQVEVIRRVCEQLGMVDFHVAETAEEAEQLWVARRSGLPALARVAKGRLGGDPAVPINKLAQAVHMLFEVGKKHGIKVSCQGHAGDGNIHPHFFFNSDEEKKTAAKARSEFHYEIIKMGGTVSAEHGVGREKAPYITKQLGEAQVGAMRAIKKALDPNNILNPGCIFGGQA